MVIHQAFVGRRGFGMISATSLRRGGYITITRYDFNGGAGRRAQEFTRLCALNKIFNFVGWKIGELIMEARVGIEPAYAELQSAT